MPRRKTPPPKPPAQPGVVLWLHLATVGKWLYWASADTREALEAKAVPPLVPAGSEFRITGRGERPNRED